MDTQKSCVVIGNTEIFKNNNPEKIKNVVYDLIENKGVRHFYNDNRGSFCKYVSYLINDAKTKFNYPIINTFILYITPRQNLIKTDKRKTFVDKYMEDIFGKRDKKPTLYLPLYYDNNVYLPPKRILRTQTIEYSARRIAEIVDYVFVGTYIDKMGGTITLECAQKLNKTIIYMND